MPRFTEALKRKIRDRADLLRCCIADCHKPDIDIHHIVPQADDGESTEDNAAPLCAGCHRAYGGDPTKRKMIRLRLPGDSSIDTGMEWAWHVEVRATPRFPLAGVLRLARQAEAAAHAAAGSRGRGACVGCPGTKGRSAGLRRPATAGSTRPGHRAAAPWVSTSRHFTRRGGQPPVRGRASAR